MSAIENTHAPPRQNRRVEAFQHGGSEWYEAADGHQGYYRGRWYIPPFLPSFSPLPILLLTIWHLLGFGGLTAAIECKRQGHDPVIYEAFPELKILGDIISFGPNAGRIFYRWNNGDIARKMRALSIDLSSYGFNIHKWDTGEIVINQKSPIKDETAPVFNGHRGELHEIVFDYAKELGVPIHLGHRVENYWESETAAGIVLDDGTKIEGDVVIGSDGVRSKARTLVLGYEDKPKSSGYAVWRAWFSNKDMIADPETKHFCENGDTFNGWIGRPFLPPTHLLSVNFES